jgi:hypothetical protein
MATARVMGQKSLGWLSGPTRLGSAEGLARPAASQADSVWQAGLGAWRASLVQQAGSAIGPEGRPNPLSPLPLFSL